MECIYCGGATQVSNSRTQKKANRVWRRRHCKACGAVFTTLESVATEQSLMLKTRTSHLEPFSRDHLFLDVYDSLRHRKTARSDATGLTLTIWSHLQPHIKDATIESKTIVEVTASILKRFDKAAATHYTAFHA